MALFRTDQFSLTFTIGEFSTHLLMNVDEAFVNTKDFKNTIPILKKNIPSILFSKCYNDKNYSFDKEVKKTETGHLFEHLIIESLFILKSNAGIKESIHQGITYWNWRVNKIGTFDIEIDAGVGDKEYIDKSVKYSMNLLSKIFEQEVEFTKPEQITNLLVQ